MFLGRKTEIADAIDSHDLRRGMRGNRTHFASSCSTAYFAKAEPASGTERGLGTSTDEKSTATGETSRPMRPSRGGGKPTERGC
jgi:hypothetical protein